MSLTEDVIYETQNPKDGKYIITREEFIILIVLVWEGKINLFDYMLEKYMPLSTIHKFSRWFKKKIETVFKFSLERSEVDEGGEIQQFNMVLKSLIISPIVKVWISWKTFESTQVSFITIKAEVAKDLEGGLGNKIYGNSLVQQIIKSFTNLKDYVNLEKCESKIIKIMIGKKNVFWEFW